MADHIKPSEGTATLFIKNKQQYSTKFYTLFVKCICLYRQIFKQNFWGLCGVGRGVGRFWKWGGRWGVFLLLLCTVYDRQVVQYIEAFILLGVLYSSCINSMQVLIQSSLGWIFLFKISNWRLMPIVVWNFMKSSVMTFHNTAHSLITYFFNLRFTCD